MQPTPLTRTDYQNICQKFLGEIWHEVDDQGNVIGPIKAMLVPAKDFNFVTGDTKRLDITLLTNEELAKIEERYEEQRDTAAYTRIRSDAGTTKWLQGLEKEASDAISKIKGIRACLNALNGIRGTYDGGLIFADVNG